MDRNQTISIITPFYNGNKYMAQLFSLVEQNYNALKKDFPDYEIELVLVNDSPAVEVQIPPITVGFRYHVINHQENSGIHQARVTGLLNCSGEYILFLDQDDVLEGDAVASQLSFSLNRGADIVISNAYMERPDGSKYALYKTRTDFHRINDLQFYLKSHNVIKSPGQCLLRKRCIPKEWQAYIMKTNGSDDLFLWILLFEKSYRFVINDRILYIHKYTGENLSESEAKMGTSSLEIVDFLRQIDFVPEADIRNLKRSREFRLEFSRSNAVKKMILAAKNMDLIGYLAIKKIKQVLF